MAVKAPAMIEAEQAMEEDRLRGQTATPNVGAFGTPLATGVPVVPSTQIQMLTHAADGRLLRGGQVTMWKPIGNGQFRRRLVPEGNIRMNLRNGWRSTCP